MLISRETDYALRILRALSDGKKRSIEEICSLEATPKQFAYRIIKNWRQPDGSSSPEEQKADAA